MKNPNHNISLPKGNVSSNQKLGLFYQDFTPALIHFNQNYFGEFDKHGIPMQHAGGVARYNQIFVIQYGLILHDLMLKGNTNESYPILLTNCVKWLESRLESFNADSLVIRNNFDYPRYNLKSGWISSMYQGQLISLLLRYGQITGEEIKYNELCRKICNYFYYNYEEGGVARFDRYGNFWLEEYPSPKGSFVLNGFIYSYFGILDLHRVQNLEDNKIAKLVKSCEATLINSIPLYDIGYWSLYDQEHSELASLYYHKNIHIPLMEILFEQTNHPIFDSYAKRWKRQLRFRNILLVKLMYRVRPRWKILCTKVRNHSYKQN
jgi:heparosan-N-sulfate-glucuronate 5-epimerase